MEPDRLPKQIDFLIELDKLKTIFRRSYLAADHSRRENDAEHMWHVSLAALVLAEYAPPGLDLNRVLRLLLVHDVVEIDAGDMSVYLRQNNPGLAAREQKAAERIFGLLPHDQAAELRAWWAEFEAGVTPEARFAKALDRLIPLLFNYYTGGKTWHDVNVTFEQVKAVNRPVLEPFPALWAYACRILDECVKKGYLNKG